MCVCVIWKPVASFSHFVRFYYIVYFVSITMEKLVLFSHSPSLDFCWLGNYGMWRGVTRIRRADRSRRVSRLSWVNGKGSCPWLQEKQNVLESCTERKRLVILAKMNKTAPGLFEIRLQLSGRGESREIIKPKLFCFEHHHHVKFPSLLTNPNLNVADHSISW